MPYRETGATDAEHQAATMPHRIRWRAALADQWEKTGGGAPTANPTAPDWLYSWDGWVAYRPFHPSGQPGVQGYLVGCNPAPDAQGSFLYVRNAGRESAAVRIYPAPRGSYVATVAPGHTLRAGPFGRAEGATDYRFAIDLPAAGVTVRATEEPAHDACTPGAPPQCTLSPNAQ